MSDFDTLLSKHLTEMWNAIPVPAIPIPDWDAAERLPPLVTPTMTNVSLPTAEFSTSECPQVVTVVSNEEKNLEVQLERWPSKWIVYVKGDEQCLSPGTLVSVRLMSPLGADPERWYFAFLILHHDSDGRLSGLVDVTAGVREVPPEFRLVAECLPGVDWVDEDDLRSLARDAISTGDERQQRAWLDWAKAEAKTPGLDDKYRRALEQVQQAVEGAVRCDSHVLVDRGRHVSPILYAAKPTRMWKIIEALWCIIVLPAWILLVIVRDAWCSDGMGTATPCCLVWQHVRHASLSRRGAIDAV